jgi:hypothetical protein
MLAGLALPHTWLLADGLVHAHSSVPECPMNLCWHLYGLN